MRNLTAKLKLSLDKKIIIVTIVAVLVSTALAITAAVSEFSYIRNSRQYLAQLPKPLSGAKHIKGNTVPKPNIDPVTLLPKFVKNLFTMTRHEVPGSEGRASEAIFEPTDTKYTVTLPLNTYVKLAYLGNDNVAMREIDKDIANRFPKDQENVVVNSQKAHAGFSNDYGSYLIGWAFRGFSVKVITTYTQYIPATNPKDALEQFNQIVALEVNSYMKNPSNKKGDQAQ